MSVEFGKDPANFEGLVDSARREGVDSDSARLLYNGLLLVFKGRLTEPDLGALRVVEGLERFPYPDGQYSNTDFIQWAVRLGMRDPNTLSHIKKQRGEIPLSAFTYAPYYPQLLDRFGLTTENVDDAPYTKPRNILSFLQYSNLSFKAPQIGRYGGMQNVVTGAYTGNREAQSALFYYLVAGISPFFNFGRDPISRIRTHLLASRTLEDLPYLHDRFVNHKMLPSDLWRFVFKKAISGEDQADQTALVDYGRPLRRRIASTFSANEKRQQALELALSSIDVGEITRLVKYSPGSIKTIFSNIRDEIEEKWFKSFGIVRVASLGEQAFTVAASLGKLLAFNFLNIWYTTAEFAFFYERDHRVKVDPRLLESGFVLVREAAHGETAEYGFFQGSSWAADYRVVRNRRLYMSSDSFTQGRELRKLKEQPLAEGIDTLANYKDHPNYSALRRALKELRIPGAHFQELPFHGHKGRWIFPKREVDDYLQKIKARKST